MHSITFQYNGQNLDNCNHASGHVLSLRVTSIAHLQAAIHATHILRFATNIEPRHQLEMPQYALHSCMLACYLVQYAHADMHAPIAAVHELETEMG